ncbi:TonB-dependent receptor [Chromobacterium haemolyticum]|uniref:TonB-dependent hemoglobin/transferrin/lactoferrin family receptor n=2 Tax=Chromobacterium haemolyticum TaxID=394935 RepID=UPI0009DAE46E|nr:TonB-dependent hemoglobin/transferrin/lactoferrin family receptor [Chromobacterium haemolyticum]MDH0343858.1 TonB-dependent hemoglobin/transferrin/lactoferrin family receptor [Chromobacterium haemolyticum]OQS34435.1 TonB-dependent receptor [Chromobacterium haemolyticum]BBH11348.1 sugar transporter [Chromobacterium haemolyticum]
MAIFRATPLVLSLAAAWPALAATPAELETVQVTAHRSSKPLAETAPNASVISRHKLDDQLVRDIADAVKYEPGVEVATDPARRGNAGYTIRGIDGNRILMLIDGIRLPESYAGGGSNNGAVSGRDYVELETLRAIDIVKGPTSSLYGSDAIGGVVGYRTKTVDDFVPEEQGVGGSVKGFGGTADNGWGSSAGVGIKGERSDLMVLYTHRNGHETDNQGNNDSSGTLRTKPNPQSWDSDNVLAKLGFKPAANQRLELTLEHYRRDANTNLLNTLTSTVRKNESEDRTQRDRVSLAWEGKQLGAFDRLAVKAYYQKLDNADTNTEWRSNGQRIFSDYGFTQDSYGLTLEAEHNFQALSAEHQLLWGADLSRSDTSRPRMKTLFNTNGSSSNVVGTDTFPNKTFPDSRSERIGLFVQDEIKFGNGLVASPSLRWDHYKMTPQPDQAFANGNPNNYQVPTFKDGAFSPKLGLSLPFADHYTGFLQFSSGFRAPPFDDANMAFSNTAGSYKYQVIPNPNLKSETSRGVELGLKGQWTDFDFGVTAYANRYQDFIDRVGLGMIDGFDTYQYQNVGKVDIKGVEGRAAWRFAPSWRAMASIAYTHGQNKQTNEPLASISPLNATLGLRYDQANFGGEALLKLARANTRLPNLRPEEARGQSTTPFKAPGYAVLDLTAYWKPAKNTVLRAGVFNVFDQKYWKAADVRGKSSSDRTLDLFTQPGRNVSASVEYTF